MRTEAFAPELSDTDWVEQTCATLLKLDPSLRSQEVKGLVLILSARPRWRTIPPERAARKVIDEPEAADGV